MDKWKEIIDRVHLRGLLSPERSLPVVPLKDIFGMSEDYRSVGYSLMAYPGPEGFFEHLLSIWSRLDVQDVLVEIYEIREDNHGARPFSERVYILTTASLADVDEWMSPLRPSRIEEQHFLDWLPLMRRRREDTRVYTAWWN